MIKFCSLYSGSSGNCIFIGTDRVKILIDAGVSGSRIVDALRGIGEDPEDLSAIFVTHEHSDHIAGAGILSRRYHLPVYATEKTWLAMEKPLGKISPENRVSLTPNSELTIGDICLHAFPIPHDAADPVAYSFTVGEKRLAVATDMGHVTETVRENIKDCDLILLESNHDVDMLKFGPYPAYLKRRILSDHGHLSNLAAADLLTELALSGTKQFFLGHLSQQNNTPACAFETAERMLKERDLKVGQDIALSVAYRDRYSRVVVL